MKKTGANPLPLAGPHWIIDFDVSRVFAQAEVGSLATVTRKRFKCDEMNGGHIVTVRAAAHRSLNIPPRLNQQPTVRAILLVVLEVTLRTVKFDYVIDLLERQIERPTAHVGDLLTGLFRAARF